MPEVLAMSSNNVQSDSFADFVGREILGSLFEDIKKPT